MSHYFENNICILKIEQQIEEKDIDNTYSYIEPLLQNESMIAMVIDCERIDYIYSSGIGVFASLAKTLHLRHIKLALYCLKDEQKEIFQMTGLDQVINMYQSKEEAISQL